MSRYDGLIIPRSYNEYINKTDAATLTQAMKNTGILPPTASQLNKLIDKTSIVVNAVCENAEDAAQKEIVLQNYGENIISSNEIACVFTNGNTYGDTTAQAPTHPTAIIKNSNGETIGTYDICDSRGHYAGSGFSDAGDLILFKPVGNKLIITNIDVRQRTNGITIYSDGTNVYNKQSVDSQLNSALSNIYPKLVASGVGEVVFYGIYNHWYAIMTNHAFGGASLTFWTPRGTVDNQSNINKLFGNPTIHTTANNKCTVAGANVGSQIEVYELKTRFA